MGRYFGLTTPLGIAHRGGAAEHLENSPAAFSHALKLGYRVLETDIHATADRLLVVHHDQNTKRTAHNNLEIAQTTWTDLSILELLNSERILRLEELFELAGSDVILNIDPKSDASLEPLIQLMRTNPLWRQQVCFGSFSTARLQYLRSELPGIPTSFGKSELFKMVLAFASNREFRKPEGTVAVQIPIKAYGVNLSNKRFIDFVHRHELDVHYWTVDEEVEMRRLYALGADALMTDRPSVLHHVLSNLTKDES